MSVMELFWFRIGQLTTTTHNLLGKQRSKRVIEWLLVNALSIGNTL